MSNTGPTQDQVDIASALNKALEETNQLFEKLAASAEGASKSINDALKNSTKFFENSEELTDQYDKLNKAIEKNYEIQDDSNDLLQKMAKKAYPNVTKATENQVRALAAMTTAYAGLNQGIEGTLSIFRLFQSGITSGFNVIQGGLKLVGAAFSSLWESASEYYNTLGREVFQANQALVEQFGALDGPTGKLVKSFEHTSNASNILAQSGKSLYTVLGDVGERIAELGKIGGAFGELLVRLGHHAAEASDSMMLLEKGMGITYETMKTMAANAEASGGTLQEQLDAVAVASAHMANKFGIDVKQIGKGFNAMAGDVLHFGDIAPEALAATAAYAVKLGVEVKNLVGIMDQFDTFESAAQSAGMLAEAFGMNVDAMDMMMSDNPAERIDQLRRAFQDTGKSVSDLSRHELKLLQQQMGGMDVESMKNALSMPVDEMGFDDFSDAMEEAGEQISLEDSLVKIADSIKLLEKAFVNLGKGPLQSFLAGFDHVLKLNKTWRGINAVNAEFLAKFRDFGMQIATSLANWVGSAEDARKAFSEFYNFEGLNKMFTNLKDDFDEFLDMLRTNPGKAGREFMENIISEATEYLGGVGTGSLTGGFKDIVQKIITAVGEMAIPLIDKIAEILHGAAAFIRGDGVESMFGDSMQNGMMATLANSFMKVFDSLKDTLLPALTDMFWALFDKIKPFLIKALVIMWTAVLIKSIITALIQQAVITAALGGFKKFMSKIQGPMEEISGGSDEAQAAQIQALGESLKSTIDTMSEIENQNIKKAGKNMMSIVKNMFPSMLAMAASIVLVAVATKRIPIEDVLKSFMILGGGLTGAYALTKMPQISENQVKSVSKTLGAAALLLLGAGLMFAGAIYAINWAFQKVGVVEFTETMTMLGVSLLASFGLALLAIGLEAMGASIYFTTGILTMTMASVFLGVIGTVLGVAMQFVVDAFSGIKPEKFYSTMDMLGVSVLATFGLAVVAAAVGATAIVVVPAAIVGLKALSYFMSKDGPLLQFAKEVIPNVSALQIDPKTFVEKMDAIVVAVDSGVLMMMAMGAMGLLNIGGIFSGIANKGLETLAKFLGNATKHIKKIVSTFNSIPIADSGDLSSKVRVIGSIMETMSSMGTMAIDAADMAITGSLLSDSSVADIFNHMNKFLGVVSGSIQGIIVQVKNSISGISESEIKALEALGPVLEAISGLATGMIDPMMELSNNSGILDKVFGIGLEKRIKLVTDGVSSLLSNMDLEGLVTNIKGALKLVTDPKSMASKAEALTAMFNAVTAIIGSIEPMVKLGQGEQGAVDDVVNFFTGGSGASGLKKLYEPGGIIEEVSNLFGSQSLSLLINNVKYAFGDLTGLPSVDSLSSLEKMFSVVEVALTSAFSFFDRVVGEDFKGHYKLARVHDYLVGEGYVKPHQAIKSIADEAVAIAEALKDMDIKLDKVKLEPQLQGIMSVSGEQEITVKPGAVNMHVHFNVTMDAEELAVTMHKGNDDTNNKGFFVLTEEAAKSEAFGGDQ